MADLDFDSYIELTAAQRECSDLDYAFQLQLQEALNLSTQTATWKPLATAKEHSVKPHAEEENEMNILSKMQALELEKYQQAAADILQMSKNEWEEDEGNFEAEKESRPFMLYYKGTTNYAQEFWGAGVAVHDPDGNLMTEIEKPLESGGEMSRAVAEYLALIEGLTIAISLGIRDVRVFGDCVEVHNQVTGCWGVRIHPKIYKYFQEIKDLFEKLDKVYMVLLTKSENRHALSLAQKAISTQIHTRAEYHNEREKSSKENCSICLEDKQVDEMHEVGSCHHRYCLLCMSQHAEVKLRHGSIPACPFEGCNHRLAVDECKKFLSSKSIEVLTKRLEEAAIPEMDKIYCPYPNCSALMTKAAVDRSQQACSSSSPSRCTRCLKCNRYFCIECRVPWHANMLCHEYQSYAPRLYGVDAKLHLLAKDKRWRCCTKCKHMIELAEGCNHITCRCGFEFCYVCGAEWKNKIQTCKCELWDEHNIIREPQPLTEDDFYYDEDDEDYEYLW